MASSTGKWTGETKFANHKLAEPLHWREPSTVFVDSMSDLFYKGFTNEQIAAVFGVMAACPHTFLILTKRAKRMREWFSWIAGPFGRSMLADPERRSARHRIEDEAMLAMNGVVETMPKRASAEWPLPNVWIGVSAENQHAADERIPELLATPAAVRFLSCEPLLGPLDLRKFLGNVVGEIAEVGTARTVAITVRHGISWCIVGCESGPGARACDVDWLRSLVRQCRDAGVPIFVKQAVETADGLVTEGPDEPGGYPAVWCGEGSHRKPGGVITLPYLDGVQHAAFPRSGA